MALPVNRPLNIIRLTAYLADSGTASSTFVVAPCRGKVVKLGSVVHAAVGTADNVLTASIAGTSVTIPTWKQLTSGSAAGDVSEVVPTAANACNDGDYIKFTSDGAGSNTTPTTFYCDIVVN